MEPAASGYVEVNQVTELRYGRVNRWPVDWSAVAVGALAALALSMVFALVDVAIGAHQLTPSARLVDPRKLGLLLMGIGVFGSFLAFAAGGWTSSKIAGIGHSESAALHGAISWLLAVPLLALLSAAGAGGFTGSWYEGLAMNRASLTAPYDRPVLASGTVSDADRRMYDDSLVKYQQAVAAWNTDTPRAVRNSAMLGATALLIGLLGAAIGGWVANGEPARHRPVHE